MFAAKYRSVALILLLALSLSGGLAFWLWKSEPALTQKMTLILVLMGGLLVFSVFRAVRKAREMRAGALVEDELTRERKLLAGARAFHLSLYLWLGIFLFNSSFTDREEMLGIAILGSAALFGICWLHIRITGNVSANED